MGNQCCGETSPSQLAEAANSAKQELLSAPELVRNAQYQNIEALIQNEALISVNRKDGIFSKIFGSGSQGITSQGIATLAPLFESMLTTVDASLNRKDSRLLLSSDTTLKHLQETVGKTEEHASHTFLKYVLLDVVAVQKLFGLPEKVALAGLDGNSGFPQGVQNIISATTAHVQKVNEVLNMLPSSGSKKELLSLLALFNWYLQEKIAEMECWRDRRQGAGPVVANLVGILDLLRPQLDKPDLSNSLHTAMEQKLNSALTMVRGGHASGNQALAMLEDMEEKEISKKPMTELDCGTAAEQNSDINMSALASNVANLRERLLQGETSAVGGAIYPRKRFPPAILDAIATEGGLKVVVFDGPATQAMEYARFVMSNPSNSVLSGCAGLEVVGLDGSGLRNLLTFPDQKQCFVLCANGISRQCHIAAGIALYRHSVTKALVPAGNIVYGSSGIDWAARFREFIERAAADDDAAWDTGNRNILGVKARGPKELQLNAVLIVQNPKDLAHVFGEQKITVETIQKGASVQGTRWLYVAHIKVGKHLVRTFIPKVGGSGLYGATCGDFVRAYFSAQVSGTKSPHILFNGTAGGFANTQGQPAFVKGGIQGLGDVKPGGIILPTKSITAWGVQKKSTPMRTVLPADAQGSKLGSGLISAMESVFDKMKIEEIKQCINFTDNHAAVMAPALETYQYIDAIVAAGHASVDVEGAPTNEAVDQVVVSGMAPSATFTPIYTHSDDPRSSKNDFYDSLAQMGPFFEGSRPVNALLEVLKFIFEHAALAAANESK